MQTISFRIKRDTYRKLAKLRDKSKFKSIDEAINFLIVKSEYADLPKLWITLYLTHSLALYSLPEMSSGTSNG